MPNLTATWHSIAHLPLLPRSSQTLSILHSSLHLFSGEHTSRVPLGSELHVLPLNPAIPISITILASPAGPLPRIGATSVTLGETLYVFGGSGPGMNPIEEGGRLWSFEAGSQAWKPLDPTDEAAPFPEARNYHTATATGGKVYIHAGCTAATGWLGDLWSFDVTAKRWERLSDGPGGPRFSASIAATGEREVWRFGGCDGPDGIGGVVDVYDIQSDTWRTIPYAPENGPAARYNSCLIPISHAGTKKEYLITIFGEYTPAAFSYDSPGKFREDIWVYDIAAAEWFEVAVAGEEKDKPIPRGSFAAAPAGGGDTGQGVVIQGGRDEQNNRLGDWWILIFD